MDNYIVYGKDGCNFCIKAVEKLEETNTKFNYIDIVDSEINKAELARLVNQDVNNIKTVPQIVYIPDVFEPTIREYVGGYTELEIKLENQ